MYVLSQLLLILALMIGQAAVSLGKPVAYILDVKEKVAVTNDGKERKAEVFGRISTSETVTFSPMSELALVWPADNRVVRFTAGKNQVQATMGDKEFNGMPQLKSEQIQRKLDPDALKGLERLRYGGIGAVTVVRSGHKPPGPQIEPIDGATILSTQPVFAWPAVAGATKYNITVRLPDRADSIWSDETKGTKLGVPPNKLEPDTIYHWEVTAGDKNDKGTQGDFSVVDTKKAGEAKKLKKLQESLNAKESDYVPVLALIASRYESLSLYSEAIQAYKSLTEHSPNTPVFHAALFELYQRAGRLDEADKSREAASRLGFQFKEEKQADKLMDDVELRLKNHLAVDESAAVKLIASVYELPANSARKYRCQTLFAAAVWSSALDRAKQQPHGDNQLSQVLDRNERLLKEKNLPAGIPSIGRLYLASYYYHTHDFSKLRAILLQDSLLKSMTSDDVSPGFRGFYWNLRGLMATDEANYALAWDCHTRALTLRRATNSAPDEAESLVNLGYLLLQIGDYDSANKALKDAVAFYRANRANRAMCAQDVNAEANLIRAQELNREYKQSINQLKQLLKRIHQDPDGVERSQFECYVRNELAVALYSAGQFKECGDELSACESIAKNMFKPDDVPLAELNANIGWHAISANNNTKACSQFETALNSLVKYHADHQRIPEFMGYLARTLTPSKPQRAGKLLEDALQLRERQLHFALSSALSERDRLAYIQQLRVHPESLAWPGEFDTYLELAPKLKVSVADQYRHVLEWKGALTSYRSSSAVEKTSDNRQQLEMQYDNLRRSLRILNRQQNNDPQRNDKISALEQQINTVERDIRNLRQDLVDTRSPLTITRIAAALPTEAALVDIVEYRRYQNRKEGEKVKDDRFYVAFIVHPDSSVTRFEIGPSDKIDYEVRQFTKAIINQDSVDGEGLNELFVRRLRQKLEKTKLLIISADGGLSRLPWCALPGLEKDKYWLEELTVTNVPSAKSFVIRQKDSGAPPSPNWLAVGDVEYGTPPGFEALSNTLQEVDHVATILQSHLPQLANVAGANPIPPILLGTHATKANVIKRIPECRIAHIATHGVFPKRDADAFGILGQTSGLDSALVFANANSDSTGGAESLLTAEELGRLDLSRLDLVVLSACDTGLGHIRAGQGLIGLSGALDQANVRSAVSSIWKVDDRATASLMEKFYDQLFQKNGHLAPAKALRNAQLALRQDSNKGWQHPYFWAAWSVSGSPGN